MNDEGYLLIPRIQRRELSSYVIHRFFTSRYCLVVGVSIRSASVLKKNNHNPKILPITNMRRYFIVLRIMFYHYNLT